MSIQGNEDFSFVALSDQIKISVSKEQQDINGKAKKSLCSSSFGIMSTTQMVQSAPPPVRSVLLASLLASYLEEPNCTGSSKLSPIAV